MEQNYEAILSEYACPHCDGTGSWSIGKITGHCYDCNGKGVLPGLDISLIIELIKGRKPGTLRSKAPEHYGREATPHTRRAYYVWRMARFHGGKDVTMPMSAMSAINRKDDLMRTVLDEIAERVAKKAYGTDMAAATRWGRALGYNVQETPDLPLTAFEGGPVVMDNHDELTNMMLQAGL